MGTISPGQMAVYRQSLQQRLTRQQTVREERREKALAAAWAIIPKIAATIPSVQYVYLFGSIIQPQQFHSDSDIDVAVIGTTSVDYFTFWRELEIALPAWPIDLRDIDDVSPFSERVKNTGLLLYERADAPATG
ncbi:MAG: hypothetical protein KA314_02700 [Chloroflexi bacterium]|nr:hypothetical protein [Chloroflexota bacterium]MBP8054718.1 hypothetical protein [Chloroflexota bacterium]